MAQFELYRYQLLPTSQQQQHLFDSEFSVEEIREQKNEFFWRILLDFRLISSKGYPIQQRVLLQQENWFVVMIAPPRKMSRETPDFQRESLDTWPHLTVFINNSPDVQIIGISRNQRAFQTTHSVVKLLHRSLDGALRRHGLTIQVKEQFEATKFWELMDSYRGRIGRVRFEMVAPNMANISHVLKIDLKKLNAESNCQKANLELEALPGTSLEIDGRDEMVASCVEYASQGGGDISVKITGIKKEIRTSTQVKTIEIDEMIFQSTDAKLLEGLIRKSLS